jgi:hypothetical protein
MGFLDENSSEQMASVRYLPIRPSVAVEPTCSCGQALECSHAAHCPRCGVTLSA